MKIFTGRIIGIKNNKTISVEVERFLSHKLYKKRYKRSKKYQVHSEKEHKVGETVKFIECKPISKTKKWRIVEK
jgi:small subunit ribosomal protein S17